MTLIAQEARRFDGRGSVSWKTADGRPRNAPADRQLLGERLYDASVFRRPKSYVRQRNYMGLYYFAQTRQHVWHESINEANMFMLLDHTERIESFASQPMEIAFSDGRRHVPDAIALHVGMEQVVYDIKPAEKISSRVIEQFAKTQAVCERVGWRYVVLPGLPEQTLRNLVWLGHFRHDGFSPSEDATRRLLAQMQEPLPFADAAGRLNPVLPQGRAELSHLLWSRRVRVDMSQPIDDTTLVRRATDA